MKALQKIIANALSAAPVTTAPTRIPIRDGGQKLNSDYSQCDSDEDEIEEGLISPSKGLDSQEIVSQASEAMYEQSSCDVILESLDNHLSLASMTGSLEERSYSEAVDEGLNRESAFSSEGGELNGESSRREVEDSESRPDLAVESSVSPLPLPNQKEPTSDLVNDPWAADEDEFDANTYPDIGLSSSSPISTTGSFTLSEIGDPEHEEAEANMDETNQQSTHRGIGVSSRIHQATIETPGTYRSIASNDGCVYQEDEEEEALRTEERFRDMTSELADYSAMKPEGGDLHDNIIVNLFTNAYAGLSPHTPAGYMHIVDWEQLVHPPEDLVIFEHVKPRLCDAVATVLFESDPEALCAFLDPQKEEVEWRRGNNSTKWRYREIIIRRVQKKVIVGVFSNLGFKYMWRTYVESTIDFSGKWREVFASDMLAETQVTEKGVNWDSFDFVNPVDDVDPQDPQNALGIARNLGFWLLSQEVWDDHDNHMTTEWAADGKRTKVLLMRRLSGQLFED